MLTKEEGIVMGGEEEAEGVERKEGEEDGREWTAVERANTLGTSREGAVTGD